jgi:alkaline phosphatase D
MNSRRQFTRNLAFSATALTTLAPTQAQTIGIFQHGVASGDPLLNRVIIWTRVTPVGNEEVVSVDWFVSDEPTMTRILQRGVTSTNPGFDYTVKVDVTRLDPNKTYYYRFAVRGELSPIGRTKTLPVGAVDRARLAVVSCSNLPYGFFNAYRLIAQRSDLDAVLHLGDYIYEYANKVYGDGTTTGRIPNPDKETVTLSDYRARYAQYRRDPDLQEAHRQHPWIIVWDDHESTNDSWVGGAENHQPLTEGEWSTRRALATQAWFEWQPVRENPYADGQIYRNFRFGNLMDLAMLDTRLEGRGEQARNVAGLVDPGRALISAEQEAWFFQQLNQSQARGTRWRFVGQQVMMGQLVGTEGPLNFDSWDGYPVTRGRFLQNLAANQVNNTVILTGDIHSSWGNEVAANPFAPSYRAQAVEFVTPAVTSPGIDDRAQATGFQQQIQATHPHVKYVELFRRGYLLLDLDRDRVQGEWYHVRTIAERSTDADLGRVLRVANNETSLTVTTTASAPRTGVAPLAP